MNPESIDTLAQELHALMCGPGRWEHAMPASQELYRKAVRVVLESVRGDVLAYHSAVAIHHGALVAAEKERDEQKARADAANLELHHRISECSTLRAHVALAGGRIVALEKVVEAARSLYARELNDESGGRYVGVSWSTWNELRAALDAAQPKDSKCAKCSGSGSVPNGTDEMACRDCRGTGKQTKAGWLARGVASVEADPPQARITAEDEPLHIPAPPASTTAQPDRTPSPGPAVLAVAPELSGCNRWRTGTRNPHTLYRDDKPAGFALDPAWGAELVAAANKLDPGYLAELVAVANSTSGQPGSSQEGGTQRDQCNDVTVSGESAPGAPLESFSTENQRAPIVAMPQPDQPGCSSPIDDPSLDGTDGAHPAWWRGHDSASEAWDKRLGQALAETAQLRADVTTLAQSMIDYGVCADDGDLQAIIQRGQGRTQAVAWGDKTGEKARGE